MDTFTGHGGRLEAARLAWPDAPRPWIDLSTGINPVPYPAPKATKAARGRLPFPEEIAALEAAAAVAFGVDDPARVVATAGAEAGLRLLPQVLKTRSAFVSGPTYASHADAWSLAGSQMSRAQGAAEAVVIVNPNNPDGCRHDRTALLEMANGLADRGGWLVVDESFAEVAPGPSLAAENHPRIVVFRSFGKFYGLAGLRLGFVIGEPGLMRQVRARLGSWPVSADAIAAGLAAYADPDWADKARLRLDRSAHRLDKHLQRAGFEILGGTSLFRLARADAAPTGFASLCAKGILTRPFADDAAWLRFGLPHPTQWGRVEAALGALR